ncbi:RagB/SusD family nutrient uptake outer membrane protein [Pseudotamlana agarivorans]|uniref:RagB/SusD family nutrient uptake outer membrane protein n=1 Tax=Pseudotamlana agarivorans TaxID=481183 RepID=UPI000831882C|nr:RagB/SusD family nutrient uptake outer membrane protein [Tamlana agarivorans]
MKKIKVIILVLFPFFYWGCSDLTLVPEDSLSPDTFFSSAEELELWTNQFYLQLAGANGSVGSNSDVNIDITLGSLMEGRRDASSEDGWTWDRLRAINYYLQNSSNCPDENARQNYDGVAYFMRAYFYFIKVRRYGDVPWYNQVLGSADDKLLFKPRDDRGFVMDKVIEDLDNAIDLLPTSKSAVRVTKWTALALKSRVALYEGTFRKYHGLNDSEKYLQYVVDAGLEFIQNSGYSIYNEGAEPYRDLFISDVAIDQEVILSRVYSSVALVMNSVQFGLERDKQGFTRNFVNHYLMSNGEPFSSEPGWETMIFPNETKNRDPRLAQTILTPGYVQRGASTSTINSLSSLTGYQSIKFVSTSDYNGNNKGVTDWPLFRTAEVYLNYAEAKAELGTISQTDLDMTINELRARVNMPNLILSSANSTPDPFLISYYTNVTQGDNKGVILEIRRERTIELVLEGYREYDLLRWKEGQLFAQPFYGCYFPDLGNYDMDNDGSDDLVIWAGTPESITGGTSLEAGVDLILSDGTSGYIFAYPNNNLIWEEDRDYLWPIPADERVRSRGVLTQNPGWTDSTGF